MSDTQEIPLAKQISFWNLMRDNGFRSYVFENLEQETEWYIDNPKYIFTLIN